MEQGGVCDALADEGGDGHQAAVAEREQVIAAPDLAEKDVVIQMRELRRELAELIVPGCLYYFLLCHNVWNCKRRQNQRDDDFVHDESVFQR